MTSYTSSGTPEGQIAHIDSVWAEFSKIATALAASYGFFATDCYVGTVANGVALTTISGMMRCPVAASLQSVNFYAGTQAGTADPTMDVYYEDGSAATILSAVVAIEAAVTNYAGTLAAAVTAAAGALYSVRVDTEDANEALTAAGCSMVWKAT